MSTVFDFITSKHFQPLRDINEAKDLFKKSIQMVEIETFSFCNRQCWFCPNSYIDRKSFNSYLEESHYITILNQLASINYDRMITYSRYNEPLADKIILLRIKQAKEMLPNALLHTNSNGDYLTKEYLEELWNAGLRSLNIQAYFSNEENFTDENAIKKINSITNKLKLPYQVTICQPNNWHEVETQYKNMRIRVYARNFIVNGCDRGGLVKGTNETKRISPCLSPFYHIYIDYNSNVVPCCNIRSDIPQHKSFILGNIKSNTIFEIYTNENAVKWRRNLISYQEKQGPCSSCSFITFDATNENLAKVKELEKFLADEKNNSNIFKKLLQRLIRGGKKWMSPHLFPGLKSNL